VASHMIQFVGCHWFGYFAMLLRFHSVEEDIVGF
jgi:hypothetical protein